MGDQPYTAPHSTIPTGTNADPGAGALPVPGASPPRIDATLRAKLPLPLPEGGTHHPRALQNAPSLHPAHPPLRDHIQPVCTPIDTLARLCTIAHLLRRILPSGRAGRWVYRTFTSILTPLPLLQRLTSGSPPLSPYSSDLRYIPL